MRAGAQSWLGAAPLAADDAKRLQKALRRVIDLKPGRRCRRDVIERLESRLGFDLGDFKAYLETGTRFFDGPNTTS